MLKESKRSKYWINYSHSLMRRKESYMYPHAEECVLQVQTETYVMIRICVRGNRDSTLILPQPHPTGVWSIRQNVLLWAHATFGNVYHFGSD